MVRLAVIGLAVVSVLAHLVAARLNPHARRTLPERVRRTLEHLGAPFVKLGQALSLRRDLLPDDVIAALQRLQDDVSGFAGAEAKREIETSLNRSVADAFAEFAETPLAAASIAQVHRARLHDGREVIVKVRRPGIRRQIDRDMRLLVAVLRLVGVAVPAIERYDVVAIAREIWTRLQVETNFRQEALNVRRFVDGFRDQPLAYVPDVEESLCTESVLVQIFSHGRRIDDPVFKTDGQRLARALIDLYLHQFFVMGVFHGDPHPGNVFVLDDGRLCFHDFGVVGELTPVMRRKLAMFTLALAQQDEDWLVDAAADLGVLSPAVDRRVAHERIGAILGEYAGRPLGDWSIGEVLIRIMRLRSGAGVAVPLNLAILARAALIVEQVLRGLDRELTVVSALARSDPELLSNVLRMRPEPAALSRLKSEAATTVQSLPILLAEWLHDARRDGAGIPVALRVDALGDAARRTVRGADRLALALVALGLYVAASLLMQHSLGPRVLGGWPLFALIGYALALWFTLRIVRGIARDSATTTRAHDR